MVSGSTAPPKPKVGVSSCLIGNTVRYDGGHKNNRYITGTLGNYIDLVAWCPEAAAGLGTPRKPIRLTRIGESIRVVEVGNPQKDVTDVLSAYARSQTGQMGDLAGFIFKKSSPSCGMERVKVYKQDGPPDPNGRGVFAREVMAAHPELPVEEEGRLQDSDLRSNFIGRVYTRHRWQQMCRSGLSPAALVAFHTQHKFFLLAHNEAVYRRLGPLIAQVGTENLAPTAGAYFSLLMEGLKTIATPARHANVLMHILGFFKNQLDARDKVELLDLIDQQRRGLVPLIVPITLINHYLRKFDVPYIAEQIYLAPTPSELLLLNS